MNLQPFNFYSSALNSRKTCYVYLPSSYEHSEQLYPVIYLLHGRGGAETDWAYRGSIAHTLEKMFASGELRESIVVMPGDGGYDQGTFYVNWYDGSGNFEDYLVYDLISAIDGSFRTETTRASRVIGGFSMGGFGAFMLALKHPHKFGAAGSLSGALGPASSYEQPDSARLLGPKAGPHALQYDLQQLALQCQSGNVYPELFFVCGKDDFLLQASQYMNQVLETLGYRHFYHEYPGEHNWDFAKEHVDELLEFFEQYFRTTHQKTDQK